MNAVPHLRPVKNYLLLILLLLGSWATSSATGAVLRALALRESAIPMVFLEISIIVVLGFLAYEIAKPTVVPSFVVAVIIGMVQREALGPLIENVNVLSVLTTLGAVIILFDGGLDMHLKRIAPIIGPILALSPVGTILTAILFSTLLIAAGGWLGIEIGLPAAILCGLALSAIDPTSIIPSFKSLTFRRPRIKDIAISESAINEFVAAVLVGSMLSITMRSTGSTLAEFSGALFSPGTLGTLLRELAIGLLVGIAGFAGLQVWSSWKRLMKTPPGEADGALFLAIPLLSYVFAVLLHGNGFLAVFVASLLFQASDHVQHAEQYVNHTVEGFMKPLIFMLLGAMIDLGSLMSTAGIGILMAAALMFVIRPLVVFAVLLPFSATRGRITLREMLFLSFVRETGVIPAVLLIGLRIAEVPGAELILDIGLWVILLTLLLQPPLTPLVARMLGIADRTPPLKIVAAVHSTAVLCSRSRSFLNRMPVVAEWAGKHGIRNLTLLHCPEDKYSDTDLEAIEHDAKVLFDSLNDKLRAEGLPGLTFSYIRRPGLLQDNIEELLREKSVSIVFVGKKMLDYRLSDIKKLEVPFVFLP